KELPRVGHNAEGGNGGDAGVERGDVDDGGRRTAVGRRKTPERRVGELDADAEPRGVALPLTSIKVAEAQRRDDGTRDARGELPLEQHPARSCRAERGRLPRDATQDKVEAQGV